MDHDNQRLNLIVKGLRMKVLYDTDDGRNLFPTERDRFSDGIFPTDQLGSSLWQESDLSVMF